LKFTR